MPLEITFNESGAEVHIGKFGRFDVPGLTEYEYKETETGRILSQSLNTFDVQAETISYVRNNRSLSSYGIEEQSAPIIENMVNHLAIHAGQLEQKAQAFNALEADLYRVPQLEQTHTAMAIEDREIRDWWRAMSATQRTKHMQRAQEDPGSESTQRLCIALLRSPAPLALMDLETDHFRNIWQSHRRAVEPDKAADIDIGRSVLEKANRGMAHLIGIHGRVTGWTADKVLATILKCPDPSAQSGLVAFQFSPRDIAEMRKRIQQGRA